MPVQLIRVELQLKKETKNMVRFDADPLDEDVSRHATVPSIYVRKTALANAFGGFPQGITVTIEKGDIQK